MRTTLTLDDDVARKLKLEAAASGRPFKVVVNELLRAALNASRDESRRRPFRVETRSFGGLRAGVELDDIGGLLERVEGSDHR